MKRASNFLLTVEKITISPHARSSREALPLWAVPALLIWLLLKPPMPEGRGPTARGGGFSPWLAVWLSASSAPGPGVEILQGLARPGEGHLEAGVTPPKAAKLATWSLVPSFRPLSSPIPGTPTQAPSSPNSLQPPFQQAPFSQRHPVYGSASPNPPEVQLRRPPYTSSPAPFTTPTPCLPEKGKNRSSLSRPLGACQDPPVREESPETYGVEEGGHLGCGKPLEGGASPPDALLRVPPLLPVRKDALSSLLMAQERAPSGCPQLPRPQFPSVR